MVAEEPVLGGLGGILSATCTHWWALAREEPRGFLCLSADIATDEVTKRQYEKALLTTTWSLVSVHSPLHCRVIRLGEFFSYRAAFKGRGGE